jgi:ATP-dependent protease ClpP protease subunit
MCGFQVFLRVFITTCTSYRRSPANLPDRPVCIIICYNLINMLIIYRQTVYKKRCLMIALICVCIVVGIVLTLIVWRLKALSYGQSIALGASAVGIWCVLVGIAIAAPSKDSAIILQIAYLAGIVFTDAGLIVSCMLAHAKRKNTATLRPVLEKTLETAPPLKPRWLAEKKVNVHIGDNVGQRHVTAVKDACEKAAGARRWLGRWRRKMLEVTIDSNGGDADSALAIADLLNHFSESYKIRIVVAGKCMSAAIIILVSVPITSRYALKSCRFMIHKAVSSDTGRRTKFSRDFDLRMTAQIIARTRINPDDLTKVIKTGGDCYLYAAQARNLGLIGRII